VGFYAGDPHGDKFSRGSAYRLQLYTFDPLLVLRQAQGVSTARWERIWWILIYGTNLRSLSTPEEDTSFPGLSSEVFPWLACPIRISLEVLAAFPKGADNPFLSPFIHLWYSSDSSESFGPQRTLSPALGVRCFRDSART